jgi:hypothetical protein
MYKTPSLPDDQLANFIGEDHGSFWTVHYILGISAVDGKFTSTMAPATTARVAAGLRKITVGYFVGGGMAGSAWCTMPVLVEAGHTYKVKCQLEESEAPHVDPNWIGFTKKIRLWIEDADTGKVFNDGAYGFEKIPKPARD